MFIYCFSLILNFAERRGFEPRIPFRVYTLSEACLFNHSSISPIYAFLEIGCKLQKMRTTSVFSYKCILFFVLPQHSQSFILNKISKLINFKIFGTLFEYSKHF